MAAWQRLASPRKISRMNQQLADHWTAAVVGVVRQHDPLAYGLQPLRHARRVLATRTIHDPSDPTAAHDLQLVETTRSPSSASTASPPSHEPATLPNLSLHNSGPYHQPDRAETPGAGLALTLEEKPTAASITTAEKAGSIATSTASSTGAPSTRSNTLTPSSTSPTASPSQATVRPTNPSGGSALSNTATRVLEHQPQRTIELDHSLGLSL